MPATPIVAQSFAEMQATMGVSIVADACIANAPDFLNGVGVLEDAALQKDGDVWIGGNGALAISFHENDEIAACIATITDTEPRLVFDRLVTAMRDNDPNTQFGQIGGAPVIRSEVNGTLVFGSIQPSPTGITVLIRSPIN
ncbi:hypothetical protein FHS89_000297 [Rubricella aquisinus]|uniref:Uncharacterized protein n=1 Tax=Rubricella aquisinus TaxID=2028108 RepID=A0A840WGN8_9RHOB|nr:hypothetical protein [Rubricella aquisinus]MBB5514299.1 hypothetical protein [Rubricella aquisinus]